MNDDLYKDEFFLRSMRFVILIEALEISESISEEALALARGRLSEAAKLFRIEHTSENHHLSKDKQAKWTLHDWSLGFTAIAKLTGKTRGRIYYIYQSIIGNPRYTASLKRTKTPFGWWFKDEIDWSLPNEEIAGRYMLTEASVRRRRKALGIPKPIKKSKI